MLTFNKLEWDLGDVKFTTTREFSVEITNNSDIPTVVNNSGSSCSCTTGRMDKNPIPANGKQNFIVMFNSNKAGRGSQVKNITLNWEYEGHRFSQMIKFKVNVVN